MSLTVTKTGDWRIARKGDPVYMYCVERAKTGRGKCRKCSDAIDKGDIRFGIPNRDPRGEYGFISVFQHLTCTRVDERGTELAEVIYGLNTIEETLGGNRSEISNNNAKWKQEKDEEKPSSPTNGKLSSSMSIKQQILDEITRDDLPANLKALDPSDLVKRGILPRTAPPNTMHQHLLPFQEEGLWWMSQQELDTPYKGGILADEMGMGKTIQIISLILKNVGTGPTLVVCPVSSMIQWLEEITKHVTPGVLDVVTVTKTTNICKEQLEAADVVLTTYPVMEVTYRRLVIGNKVSCKYCGKAFLASKIGFHNKYFCGPESKRTAKQMKQEKKRGNGPITKITSTGMQQSKATIKKGLRSLHVDIDLEDDEEDAENAESHADTPDSKAGSASDNGAAVSGHKIAGPMGIYKELMMEAGRKVMSRWDRKRLREGSSSSGDNSEGSDKGDDNSPHSSRENSNDISGDTDGSTHEKEDDVNSWDIKANSIKQSFICEVCQFPKLRFPYCPKTGNSHVVPSKQVMDRMVNGEVQEDDISDSVMHSISWFRVVLDEAHRIKGRSTSTARSIYALRAERRWCVTGTPLQNRVGDIYSLLRFLQVPPYSEYYCMEKGCSCTSLSHPFIKGTAAKACAFCGHGPLKHTSYFNRHILNPINRYGYVGNGVDALLLLNNDVLNSLMLRRTKAERSAEMSLPSLTIVKQNVVRSKEEVDLYESLYRKSTNQFNTFVKKGTVLHNYAHIFQLLSRLRQALDHPYLVTRNMPMENVTAALHVPSHVCAICRDDVRKMRSLTVQPCKHAFHPSCLSQYIGSIPDMGNGGVVTCPACFVPMTFDMRLLQDTDQDGEFIDDDGNCENGSEGDEEMIAPALPPGENTSPGDDEAESPEKVKKRGRCSDGVVQPKGILANLDMSKFVPSAKLLAILDYLQNINSKNLKRQSIIAQRGNCTDEESITPAAPPTGDDSNTPTTTVLSSNTASEEYEIKDDDLEVEKTIVFSQFGAMLDLIEHYVARSGIGCVKLTGSLPMPVRGSILNAFRNDPKVTVILISLKAGGEGLNLQNANHVLLTDPWWNPAVEMQAVQRAHRIGQRRPVTAVKFVTGNTIEERMMDLQDKKMLVFEGTVDGKCSSLQSLTTEDIQFLFL